jgi:transcriptional regulator with XRE-family HTH domain
LYLEGSVKGSTLRMSRLRRRLRQQDLADAMGCSRPRVGQLEQLGAVPPRWVAAYQRAVQHCTIGIELAEKAAPVIERPGAADASEVRLVPANPID